MKVTIDPIPKLRKNLEYGTEPVSHTHMFTQNDNLQLCHIYMSYFIDLSIYMSICHSRKEIFIRI